MNSDISFVYFDVGGVVVHDFNGTDKWAKFKKEIGIPKVKDKEFEAFWSKYEAEVCVGRDVETIVPLIKERFGSKFSVKHSFLIDEFVNHFEVNRSIWPAVKKAHMKYKIGLLTNMYPHMFEAIKNHNLLPDVPWDVIIDSSVVGIKKPGREIFELAEQKANSRGKRILFVDDKLKNTKAAEELSWQTFLYDPAKPEESSNKLSALL